MNARSILATVCSLSTLIISSAFAGSMLSSSNAPAINDADIANYGAPSGTQKWFVENSGDGAAKGQSFTTGGAAVRLKSITYQVSEGNGAEPTKTYALRVGEVAGTNFTVIHSETATQDLAWTSGQYMTWTFDTPVLLEPNTTYAVDVGMTSSNSSWQTGIPYINMTGDDYAGGSSYITGTSGVGTPSLTIALSSDRIFHLDIESLLGPVFSLVAPSPADGATDVLATREIIMTFSQSVAPGAGNLTIRNLTDNSETSLPASDSRLTYDQNVVRINPAGLIAWSKDYAIRIDAGMFLGDGGAPIAAISDDTTWNFTTLADDPLLAAIAALKSHITGSITLTGPQISAHKTTIDSQRQRFAESTIIITAVFDLITTYDTAKGPLFVSGSAVTSFDRNTTSVSPENYHWVVYTVMQHAMDVIYTAENLAKYEGTLANYKFGSHTSFPGPCTPPANPANAHTVSINGSFPVTFGRNTQMWTTPARKPTGTYLAPGTIATVTVPQELVNAGYKVRVGAHSWDLSGRRPVNRMERATRLYALNATSIKVASPYGGGIYIEVPFGADLAVDVVPITITGGVRSPYFSAKSFHQTTPTEWDVEKTHPAPWADFQSEKFMTQVPRKWIYNMTGTQATQLMVDWDKAMDSINGLMGFDLNRGKETMYCQSDVILRSSVHAPGYPAVNVTSNVNSEVSPVGYAGNYLVRGPNVSLTAANIEFHEQGHAYFFPKFGGESESNVNLLQPAMLTRAFGKTFDQAQNGSFGGGNTFITMDTTAIAWMCVFSFSPNEIPMQQGEKQYQHKGHAKWMDIARLFGWEKLDAYWRSFMLDDAANIPYGSGTDDLLLRLSKSCGADIRPLFHFWGIHPQNPTALAAAIAAENIPASTAIRDQLLHYKSIVPANNAAFRSFALGWWGRQPSVAGYWEETDHAMQWDETLDADGTNNPNVRPNGSIYVETSATEIRNRIDELVDLYFPSGISPTQMAFAIAPSAVEYNSSDNMGTIGMTAFTATAANPPIQYYFENTTNSTNSGWISSTSWQQGGLAVGNYSYRVKARNGLNEETVWSNPVVASLTASGDITPPSPSPMAFSTPPYALDENTITMAAATASDVNAVEYEFANTSGGGGSSAWQASQVFTDGNLLPTTEYGYRVRARDSQGNTTAWSTIATTNTANIPDVTAPQIVSLSPAGAFTDVAANLVATFDEPVLIGSGNITLKNLTDGTQTVFAINDTARVSISGAVVTINPATDLSINKSYSIRITAGALVDTSNNPFIGINDDSTWAFNVILADPLAVAGGPYDVVAGAQLALNATGSLPSEGATITAYEWDLDNDGDYDEAILGQMPAAIPYATLTAAPPTGFGMVAGTNTIKLRVTDSAAKSTTAQTTVNLLQLFTFDGANKSNGDNWNTATNWNPDAVPANFASLVIPANKYVTADANTPAYTGDLTIGAGATLQCGYGGAAGLTFMNALGNAASTTITMGAGSGITLRGNYSPVVPAMVLQGDVSLTIGTSTSFGPDPTFSKGITGPYTVYLEGKSDSFMTINTTANTFSGLVVRQVTASGLNIDANVAGALGTGDVTIRANQSGIISGNLTLSATDAIASTATLSLYGPASATKLKLTANNTVRKLVIDGVTQPGGTYGKVGSGAQYQVSWINSTSTATLTVAAAPSLYWDLNDSTDGAGSTAGVVTGTWDAGGNLWNNAAGDGIALPWTPGQQAVFSAGTDATGTSTVTVNGTHDIGGVAFEDGNVALTGGGLRMTSDSETNVATGLSASIATPISNDSARRLTKLGLGTLTLSGASTYTGATRIDQGILSIASLANAGTDSPIGNFPTSGAPGLILSGGTLQYTGSTTMVNRGFTLMGNSTLDIPTAGATLTLGNCETANQPGTLTVTGGAGSVLAIGQARIVEAAQLTLNPTTATMIVGSANGYTSYNQSSILTLSGSSTGNIVSGIISETNPPGSAFAQPLALVKSGSGDWRLNGVSTYVGNTTVNAGNLIAGTNALNNANGAFGKQNNVDLSLGVANGNDHAGILIGGAFTIGRTIRLQTQNTTDTGTRVLTLGGNTAHGSTFSGAIILGTASQAGRGVTLTAASGGTVTFSGVIQNPATMDATTFTVTKSGAGKVVLSNSNTHTGGTVVSEGTLEITGAVQSTTSITFTSDAKLGLVIGSPVTAASAAVNFTNGTVTVSGSPSAPSHVLLTALSFTGTPVLTSVVPGYQLAVVGNQLQLNQVVTDPYALWSGGAAFAADANNDGVASGMAWLLGAANPSAAASVLLPKPTNESGKLVLTFRCLKTANRGGSVLKVQYSNDLGQTDPWTSHEALVPDADGTVGVVFFDTTADADPAFIRVRAEIPASAASAAGQLFGRLHATSN